MLYHKFAVAIIFSLLPFTAFPQSDLIGGMVGTVTGLVENESGDFVEPQTALDAVVDINSAGGGDLTAVVDGVASCTGGLGMQVTFHVTFGYSDMTLSGFYTDIPNGKTLDKPILFEHTGGLNWTANITGSAPSATGKRAYDLNINITLPKEAIFPGEQYPDTRSYSGDLSQVVTVDVPIEIPVLSVNEVVSVDVALNGRWSAKTVPTSSSTPDINGTFNGSIEGVEPLSLTLNVPVIGEETLSLNIAGTFGGSLFVTSPTELTFFGSWAASAGEDGFGGDMNITVPLEKLSELTSMPFELNGNFSVDPDIPGVSPIPVAFGVTGNFPFNIDLN